MKTQKLSFTNQAKTRLAGRLDLPADDEPIADTLFAHCFTCNKNLKAVANISRALTAARIAVLRFDFTMEISREPDPKGDRVHAVGEFAVAQHRGRGSAD